MILFNIKAVVLFLVLGCFLDCFSFIRNIGGNKNREERLKLDPVAKL
jgi:hypothetical protein